MSADTRTQLIESMKELLWERGYDATSPNQVLERSGAGKGSFYHHFKGKKELAIAAMEDRADELIAEFEALFGSDQHWLTKLEDYLLKPRDGLKGCRIGRIAQDPSLEDVLLRLPMTRYFNHLQLRLTALFNEAKELGELPESCNAENLAATVISTLQGGFVLSRGVHDPTLVTDACRGLLELLHTTIDRQPAA